jgi:hypothetical protein
MLRYLCYLFYLTIIMSLPTFAQETWVPFLQQTYTKPATNLTVSNNSNVSFNVQINGMQTSDKKVDASVYQSISIPDAEVMTKEGSPQIPMMTKLIAIPDCDNVSITVSPSNQLQFENYNVLPVPRYEKKKLPDGSDERILVFEEDKSVYSTNSDFPGKYGEILEIGYVRGQKVARVAICPIQFNPASKRIKVYTNFNISLSFVNSTSPVNKELGIFRGMMHHTALNYELSGNNASTKILNEVKNNNLSKGSPESVTAGSVLRVTNLSTLKGTNAIPMDYLIITHSSLFNSNSLTTLANHRRDYNGYDVVIVRLDEIYSTYPHTPSPTNDYISIRDFIADVFNNGKANHTGDGHLGYICLVGDALMDNNSTVMLPAAYPPYYAEYDLAGDYYYACTGGDSDNLQDLMYGRISVGNETELSNVVNKIISYESNSNGSWNNNSMFISMCPDFTPQCDQYIKTMTETIPTSNQISYSFRAYSGFTTSVTKANPIFGQAFTTTQYNDPNNLCGSDLLNNWIFNQLNATSGIHTFVYEDHGDWNRLGGEGCGRKMYYLNDGNCLDPSNINSVNNRLNNSLYTFMIFNCCETGHFDYPSGDCVAEVSLNLANKGAIGVLASTRISNTMAFGYVDQYILDAQYKNLSHIMGEAVMESKLKIGVNQFRRQYNLYGDPAVNLWPTGYTISQNLTLSGSNLISENLTVASGVTLTISPGAILRFADGKSLTVNGVLNAAGTSIQPITFTSASSTSPGSWGPITLNTLGANGSSIRYCNIKYGTEIDVFNTNNVTIQNCNITNSSMHGLNFSASTGCSAINDTIINSNSAHGILVQNGATVTLKANKIKKTSPTHVGVGIDFGGGGTGTVAQNDISGFSWGLCAIWGSSPNSYNTDFTRNNRITNCSIGLWVYNDSYPIFGTYGGNVDPFGGNSIYGNPLNVCISNSYPYSSSLRADDNWWGHYPPYDSAFSYGSNYFTDQGYLSSDLWAGIPLIAVNNPSGDNSSLEIENQNISAQISNIVGNTSNNVDNSSVADSLITGINLMGNNNFIGAKNFFISYLLKHPDNQTAYTYLYNCADNGTISEITEFFNSLPIVKEQKLLLSYLYLRQGKTESAKIVNNNIIASNPNTPLAVRAMHNNFYIALYNENDIQTAVEILNEIKSQANLSSQMEISLADDALSVYGSVISANSKTQLTKQVGHEELPTSYSLSQNYPNPFNPSTTIRYQIPKPGLVTLKIYDILGREIATLVNENKNEGSYDFTFNASRFGSGVYIYQIRVNDYVSSKKMILLK